ncbi:MAG TPA: sugar-binding transcriptional regulator [Rubrobacter sp.]|nr:sugar-binding transcriptional regulator [Rubrobacter sp.]
MPSSELRRLVEAAHLYYINDFTQERVASLMGVSRSKVSRMLKEARARGLIEFRVRSSLITEPGLQKVLQRELGLKECLVLAAPESSDEAERVGALAGQYLQENIDDGNVVGVGWSSAVYSTVTNSGLQKRQDLVVAQLMGSVGNAIIELNGMYVTGRLADDLGASAHYIHAPMIVTDTAVRDGLLRDPYIRKTLEVARHADVILVGIGAVNENLGQYRAGYLDDADLEDLWARGAVGEVIGTYISPEGQVVPLELNERIVGLDFRAMRKIPLRVGVSWGARKALANIGAARSGLINVLVTDENTADEMATIINKGTNAKPGETTSL